MSEIEISIAESKKDFTKLIRDTAQDNKHIIITRRGNPAAVIVSYNDYKKLKRLAQYAELINIRERMKKSGVSATEVYEESKKILDRRE